MPEWPFIAAAYGLTWATLAGYAIYLARRSRRAAAALRRLGPGGAAGRGRP